ncbi:MAG: 3-deoxy-manno-octulosonate cytidylyltransferase [Pirellulaceae bacterium]
MAQSLKSHIVIPARLHSTRLPEKLLLSETGKPVIQHTYESAAQATKPDGVLVATDHQSILTVVQGFGGHAVMTDPDAPSGTDRVAEAAATIPDADIIVNVQGDEPDISATAIDLAIELLESNPDAVMSTLATPIRSRGKLDDPSCVKVVVDSNNAAMYFSRSTIPHPREWSDELLERDPPVFLQHVGLYAYRREFLLQLSKLPQSTIETVENLEQLRVLSLGYAISVGVINEPAIGIDTQADYDEFVSQYRNR